MEQIQNPFDIHVGRINARYKEYWGYLNSELFPKESALRSTLAIATKVVCDKRRLFEPLVDFICRSPDIIYNPRSTRPIQIGEETVPVNTWLLRFDKFCISDQVYDWEPDILLTTQDDQFDLFFAYLWLKTDVMESDDFLNHHFQRSHFKDKGGYCRYLRRVRLKYNVILAELRYTQLINEYEAVSQSEHPTKENAEGKSITIRMPKVVRRQNDSYTSLSIKATTKLIVLLCEQRVILADEDQQTRINIAKAWQVLTGYNANSLREKKLIDNISMNELESLGKVISKIKILIDKEIGTKRGGKK